MSDGQGGVPDLDESAEPGEASSHTSPRQLITEFATLLYERKQVAEAFTRFVSEDYIQHSPSLPDGRDAAVAVLAQKFGDPNLALSVRHLLVDADMGVLLIHGQNGDVRFAVVDVYRVADGRIVEHWDVNQVFPAEIHSAHPFFA
jgi:predicted SnoaL-like aldol condensation-catalyzing enzyme